MQSRVITFHGVLAVFRNAELVQFNAKAYSDADREITNNPHLRYNIGTGSASFTAIAILQMIDQGMLHFENKIGELLDINLGCINPKITLRQLLMHTSGVQSYCDEADVYALERFFRDVEPQTLRTPSDYLPFFKNKPMLNTPGKSFHYSGGGLELLGLVIEKVSGMPFAAYMNNVFFPIMHMYETNYCDSMALNDTFAKHYLDIDVDGPMRSNADCVPAIGSASGGAYATLHDIDVFWRKLYSGNVLRRGVLEQAVTKQVMDGKDRYGMGFWVDRYKGSFYPVMEGHWPGVGFCSEYFPQRGITIVAMGNSDGSPQYVMTELRKLYIK